MLVQKRPRQDLMRYGGLGLRAAICGQSAEAQEKAKA
jgi:hypothetical protein